MDAPFSEAKAQEQIRGKSTGGARPKPTSNGWESPGGRELSLIDLLITILLCVKGIECQTFCHQEKTQCFVPHRCAGVKQMNLVVSGIGSDLWPDE